MKQISVNLDEGFLFDLLEGDRDFAEDLFDTYVESMEENFRELQEALAVDPVPADVHRPLHSLKGASASVGLMGVQQFCQDLEQKAKAGHTDECRERLSLLRETLDLARARLQQYLDSM